jgi:hypothetical protein
MAMANCCLCSSSFSLATSALALVLALLSQKYFAQIRRPFHFLQYSGQCCGSALVLMRIRIQGAKSMQILADLDPLFRIRNGPG